MNSRLLKPPSDGSSMAQSSSSKTTIRGRFSQLTGTINLVGLEVATTDTESYQDHSESEW